MYQECYVTGERKYGTKGVFDLSTIILGEDDNLRNWHERSAFQLVAVKARGANSGKSCHPRWQKIYTKSRFGRKYFQKDLSRKCSAW